MQIQQNNDQLLNQLMAPAIGAGSVGAPAAAMAPDPAAIAAQAPAPTPAQRRQEEIMQAEQLRAQKAQERLKRRQENNSPDVPRRGPPRSGSNPIAPGGMPPAPFSAESLIKPEVAQAEARIGERDRKPMGQWGKADWGKFIMAASQGFGAAKGGGFADGLSAASLAGTNYLQGLDANAAEFDEKQRRRAETLQDMMLEERIRYGRTSDERLYNDILHQRDRGERREDVDDTRRYNRGLLDEERNYAKEEKADDRKARREEVLDARTYEGGVRQEERKLAKEDLAEQRKYASEAQAAANKREDAKAVRDAAGKLSRNYQQDYIAIAKNINDALSKADQPVLTGEELTEAVMEQMRGVYGIGGGLGSTAPQNVLPTPLGLKSGLQP